MLRKTPKLILTFLAIILLSGMYSIVSAQQQGKDQKKEAKESFKRPEPQKPMQPTIPKENRYQDDKVFLENADSLYRPPHDMEERQIVKGSVQFRQGGMYMFCDSAYYWPTRNSMDAFGHVLMKQGDTLFVYSDKLYYDGMNRHAILVAGPTQREVVMKNREVTLTTDSLDYDVVQDLGWYSVGGKLVDGVNTLTSQYGQYSPTTKIADFRGDVVLVNNKDGYKLYTEELRYNTATSIADINTETLIEGENDTIITTQGWYDTKTDNATLTARSTILHRDSAGNVVTLEGDSLIYDKLRHISEAYMFRNANKRPRPMVLTDTARKMQLVGGFGMYNDLLQEAMATDYPLLIEYSRPDTLFLRADTILTFQRTEKVWPDSLAHNWSKETRDRLHSYSSLAEMVDVMTESLLLLPKYVLEPGNAVRLLGMDDIVIFPPVGSGRNETQETQQVPPSEDILADASGEMPDNVPEDMPEGMPDHTPALPVAEEIRDSLERLRPKIDKLGRDSAFMVDKNYHAAKAIGKARFFKSDLQGIADTILYHQYDSMLYMQRKPVVWSEERQIFGDTIKVHMIDSVADWAHLPAGGMVIEHIDDDFYNQLSGSEIKALSLLHMSEPTRP
ncbi:MAG: hypothetical protein K2H76_06095, partial [Muribaculaceae bacterium]|nr:hypothetical protein [Muribaculaceae bacterium]